MKKEQVGFSSLKGFNQQFKYLSLLINLILVSFDISVGSCISFKASFVVLARNLFHCKAELSGSIYAGDFFSLKGFNQ